MTTHESAENTTRKTDNTAHRENEQHVIGRRRQRSNRKLRGREKLKRSKDRRDTIKNKTREGESLNKTRAQD